jgi:predicted NBD/HSP70 family sugar kinase
MTKKILELIAPQPGAPNEKVINLLRETLKEAREGKVQAIGIAIALIDPNGDNGRSTETVLSAADGWYHSLAAAVNGLAFRLNYERYIQGGVLPSTEITAEDE